MTHINAILLASVFCQQLQQTSTEPNECSNYLAQAFHFKPTRQSYQKH